MPVYYEPLTISDRIDLDYTRGQEELRLRIMSRRIRTTHPITSSILNQGFTNQAGTGWRWLSDSSVEGGVYSKNSSQGGSYNFSYSNSNFDTEHAQLLYYFNSLIMEIDETTTADMSNVLVMGSSTSDQWYDESVPEADRTFYSGQLFTIAGTPGKCRIALFGKTAYTPDPVTQVYNGALFSIETPAPQYFIENSSGNLGTYSTANPPWISFWTVDVQMDDADHDGDHYGEVVPCMLIVTHTPGAGSYLYMSTLISINVFNPKETEDEPTTDDPAQTVTPSGWVGAWDFSTDSDEIQAVTGHDFVNRWQHGVRLYYISDTQAESFMTALWGMTLSQAVDLAIDSALFRANVDFIRGVICLHKLPIVVPTSGSSALSIMGFDLSKKFSGLGSFAKVSGTYGSVVQVSTAELPIKQTYGDTVFMDWQNCKAEIRLPFVGNVPIDIRSIRGGSIQVCYNIDVLTGNLIAQVFCKTSYTGAKVLLYQGSGNCALPIPFSGNTEGAFKQLGAAAGLAGGIASGIATKSISTAVSGLSGLSYGQSTAEYKYVQSEGSSMTDLNIKLIISGDIPIVPPQQRALEGFQAATTAKVSAFVGSGFLSGTIHAEITGATDAEQRALEALFAGGVIV